MPYSHVNSSTLDVLMKFKPIQPSLGLALITSVVPFVGVQTSKRDGGTKSKLCVVFV
jgi:hypothetical protein